MSREVDERIVEMQFDNKQFESGVSQTLKTLDKLNSSLQFEGVSKAIDGVQSAINKIDANPIANNVMKVADAYTTLTGKIKMEVFDRLANYAVDTGEKIFEALTMKGAKAGFAEYETQQGAVQTILANTQHLGTTITDVNKALDDLNEYADLTIYNFTEMTRNIGTFTAAGLDLETSTSAIKGIANLAAVSGSTSEQASRAMYQLSQALAAGRVNLMDWNSVVNAGMGGKVFQDALKRTAKHMGIAVDESKSFRESISGSDTWLSADVLSETLKQFSGDLDEAALAADGWSESEIKEITAMAKTATDAATVVKTFSQLISTVDEQIGSGWTKSWQLIFGDFEESKELWTSVYKALSPYIEAISDLRNGYLQFWKENEGREKVLQAFSNIWSGTSNLIDTFTGSLKKAFPMFDNFGQILVDASDRFLKFSERFKVVKDKADQVTDSFEKVSDAIGAITAEDKKNALDIWNWGNINGRSGRIDGQDRVEALGESYDRVQKYINTFIETGYDVAKTDELLGVGADAAAEGTKNLTTAIENSLTPQEKLAKITDNIAGILHNVATVVKTIVSKTIATTKAMAQAFMDVLDPLQKTGDLKAVTDVFAKIAKIFETTAEKAENMRRIFRGVFAAVDIVYQLVRTVVKYIGRALIPVLDNIDSSSGGILEVLGNMGDWIFALDNAIKEGDLFSVAIEKMISFVGSLGDKLVDGVHAFEDWSGINFASIGKKIVSFFSMIFGKIYEFTGIDIGAMLSKLWENIKIFFGYIKAGDFAGAFSFVVDGVKGLATAIIEGIKNIDISKVKAALGGAFGKIGEVISGLFEGMWAKIKAKSASGGSGGAGSGSGIGVLDIFGGILYGAYYGIKKIIETISGLFSSEGAKDLWTKIKDFFSGLFNATDAVDGEQSAEKTKTFGDILVSVGHYLRLFFDEIKPIIGTLFGGSILKSVNDITTATKNFSEGPVKLLEGFDNLTKSFKEMQKSLKIETMTRFVKALGTMIIEFVIAIAALAIIDYLNPEAIGNGIYAITTILAEVIASLWFVNQKLDSEIDMLGMIKFAKSLGSLILKLSVALWIIGKIDNDKIYNATLAFTAIMSEIDIMLFTLMTVVKELGEVKGAEAMMLTLTQVLKTISTAVIKMAVAMMLLSFIDADKLDGAMLAFTLIMASMAGLIFVAAECAKLIGENPASFSAMGAYLMELSATMLIASVALGVISLIPADKIEQAILSVTVLAGLFAILMFVAAKVTTGTAAASLVAAGGAMMMFALAMLMMVPALMMLSVIPADKMANALKAFVVVLGAVLVAMYALSAAGGANVALVGLGILLLAAAFAVLTPAIIAFGTWAIPVFAAFLALVDKKGSLVTKTIGYITLLGFAMIFAGLGAAVLGVGLAVIGAATLLLTPFILAVGLLAGNIYKLAKIWNDVRPMLQEIGVLLGKAFGDFFGALGDAMTQNETKIRQGLVSFINILASAFVDGIPAIVDAILTMIANILIAIDDNLPDILLHLGSIIDQILTWANENSLYWAYQITNIAINIILGVIQGIIDRLDEIMEKLYVLMGKLFWALVDLTAHLIYDIGVYIGKIFKGSWKFWEEHGGNMIMMIVEGVKNNWIKLRDWVKSLFTEKIPGGLKSVWDTVKGWGKSIVTGIIDGIKAKWEEAKETVREFGKSILETLGIDVFDERSPSKETSQQGLYLSEGIAEGVEDGQADAESRVYDSGYDILDAMQDGADDAADDWDMTYQPEVDIQPELQYDEEGQAAEIQKMFNGTMSKVDMSQAASNIGGLDLNKSVNWAEVMNANKPTTSGDFASVFNSSTTNPLDTSSNLSGLLGNTGIGNDLQVKSNELTEKLNGNMEKLVDSFKNGMINIPDNATFSTAINIDGRQVAEASAPYLDTIQASSVKMAERGVSK